MRGLGLGVTGEGKWYVWGTTGGWERRGQAYWTRRQEEGIRIGWAWRLGLGIEKGEMVVREH